MDLRECPAPNKVLITHLSVGTNYLQALISSSQQLLYQSQNNLPKVIGSKQNLLMAVTLFISLLSLPLFMMWKGN